MCLHIFFAFFIHDLVDKFLIIDQDTYTLQTGIHIRYDHIKRNIIRIPIISIRSRFIAIIDRFIRMDLHIWHDRFQHQLAILNICIDRRRADRIRRTMIDPVDRNRCNIFRIDLILFQNLFRQYKGGLVVFIYFFRIAIGFSRNKQLYCLDTCIFLAFITGRDNDFYLFIKEGSKAQKVDRFAEDIIIQRTDHKMIDRWPCTVNIHGIRHRLFTLCVVLHGYFQRICPIFHFGQVRVDTEGFHLMIAGKLA